MNVVAIRRTAERSACSEDPRKVGERISEEFAFSALRAEQASYRKTSAGQVARLAPP